MIFARENRYRSNVLCICERCKKCCCQPNESSGFQGSGAASCSRSAGGSAINTAPAFSISWLVAVCRAACRLLAQCMTLCVAWRTLDGQRVNTLVCRQRPMQVSLSKKDARKMPNTSNIKFATCDLRDKHKNDTSGGFWTLTPKTLFRSRALCARLRSALRCSPTAS